MPDRDKARGKNDVLRVFQTKKETRAFYDKISAFYDFLAERSEGPIRAIGLEHLAAQTGHAVLEIGYGTGGALVELATTVGPSGRVIGVDLSRGMAGQTRARLGKRLPEAPVQLVCGDAEQLPLRHDSIDGIFMSFTLELFDTPAIPVVLAECRRVLRQGGRIAIVSLSKDAPPGLALDVFQWTHEHFPSLLDCRPIYAQQMLEAAGFEIITVRQESMWVPVDIVIATSR